MGPVTVHEIDAGLVHLRRISKDVTRSVEERKAARRHIDEELDRRNEIARGRP